MSKAKLLMAQSLLFTLFKIYLPIQLIIQKLIIAIKSCKKILKKVKADQNKKEETEMKIEFE